MSAYEVTPDWKSPRKIEEDIRNYTRKRFEDYMELVEVGLILTRELGIAALRAELAEPSDDGCSTQEIDTNEIRRLLEEDGEAG